MAVISNIHIGLTAWASGQTIATGARRSNAGSAYQATTSGTTGATGPTQTSGTASDGSVTWKFLSVIDYTSVSAWAAAIPGTLTQPIVGQIWNNGEIAMSGSPWLSLSGHTTSSTNTITLCAAPGESFSDNGSASTNPLVYDPTKGVGIKRTGTTYVQTFSGNDQNVVLRGLQFKNDTATGNTEGGFGANAIYDQCIFDVKGSALQMSPGMVRNCLFINSANANSAAASVSCFGGTTKVYNCTFVTANSQSTKQAINVSYGNVDAVNGLSFGWGYLGGGNHGTITWDHGVSDATGGGNAGTGFSFSISNSLTGKTATNQFVSPSADSRLKSGADAIGAGTSTGAPTVDIIGTSRPQGGTFDAGAFEFVTLIVFRRPFVSVSA